MQFLYQWHSSVFLPSVIFIESLLPTQTLNWVNSPSDRWRSKFHRCALLYWSAFQDTVETKCQSFRKIHIWNKPIQLEKFKFKPGKCWRAAVCRTLEWKLELEWEDPECRHSRWTSTGSRGCRSPPARRWSPRRTGTRRWATGKQEDSACSCLPSGTPVWCADGHRTERSTGRCPWRRRARRQTPHSPPPWSACGRRGPLWSSPGCSWRRILPPAVTQSDGWEASLSTPIRRVQPWRQTQRWLIRSDQMTIIVICSLNPFRKKRSKMEIYFYIHRRVSNQHKVFEQKLELLNLIIFIGRFIKTINWLL